MNITVGKYLPGDSFVHRLDPRLKLFTTVLFIALVFLAKTFILQFFLLLPIFLSFLNSKLPRKQLIRMIFPVLFIGIFLFFVNMFVVEAKNNSNLKIYFTLWKFNLSNIAIKKTLIIMIRIYIMILITVTLTSTTMPTALTRAIEDLLWPLKFLFVPVHIIAMIISIALRFIPTLLEESQRIMKAQASRGVDFKNGNFKSKAKSIITLIIPLFVSAFAKAEDLGNAMETRGYDPYEKRTKYREYPIKLMDILTFFFIIGIFVVVILEKTSIIVLPTLI